jgi:tRNA pseudouridine38-40 synthase
MRFALGLEYDGTAFCGWQTQPSGCAVQDTLDRALSQIAAHSVVSQCAGRTDAGVHALGQVVHFDTPARRPSGAWVRGVNTLLPRSIAVQWVREVSADFHARFAARGRTYVYLLLNRRERPGLFANYLGWHHHPLDVGRMQEAACSLLGTRDFSAFRSAECQAHSPVKELRRAEVERQGDLISFRFCADAFLHHMVRNLVGCLVKVGNGSASLDWLAEVVESRDRTRAAPTFAGSGLYLTAVDYEPQWGFPPAGGDVPAVLRRTGLGALLPA